jgi:hypothetical protein
MNASAKTDVAVTDDTGRRIFAYLHSLRFMEAEQYGHPGREVIERLAIDNIGMDDRDPAANLSIAQCVEVLEFMAVTEPKDMEGWLRERNGEPSVHCGFLHVLNIVTDSLRKHQPSVEEAQS